MAYSTITTGTTITSSWANADVRDQVVVPFASTAARSSAITSPVTGQVSTLTTNLSTEGLYVYTSAATWRAPWNLPWGQVTYSTTTTASSTTSGTTELVIATSGSFTAVANRLYKVTWTAPTLGTAASDLFAITLRSNNISGTIRSVGKLTVVGSSYQQQAEVVAYVSGLSAGTEAFVITATRQAGTGTLQTLSGGSAFWLVEDVGPTGAPS